MPKKKFHKNTHNPSSLVPHQRVAEEKELVLPSVEQIAAINEFFTTLAEHYDTLIFMVNEFFTDIIMWAFVKNYFPVMFSYEDKEAYEGMEYISFHVLLFFAQLAFITLLKQVDYYGLLLSLKNSKTREYYRNQHQAYLTLIELNQISMDEVEKYIDHLKQELHLDTFRKDSPTYTAQYIIYYYRAIRLLFTDINFPDHMALSFYQYYEANMNRVSVGELEASLLNEKVFNTIKDKIQKLCFLSDLAWKSGERYFSLKHYSISIVNEDEEMKLQLGGATITVSALDYIRELKLVLSRSSFVSILASNSFAICMRVNPQITDHEINYLASRLFNRLTLYSAAYQARSKKEQQLLALTGVFQPDAQWFSIPVRNKMGIPEFDFSAREKIVPFKYRSYFSNILCHLFGKDYVEMNNGTISVTGMALTSQNELMLARTFLEDLLEAELRLNEVEAVEVNDSLDTTDIPLTVEIQVRPALPEDKGDTRTHNKKFYLDLWNEISANKVNAVEEKQPEPVESEVKRRLAQVARQSEADLYAMRVSYARPYTFFSKIHPALRAKFKNESDFNRVKTIIEDGNVVANNTKTKASSVGIVATSENYKAVDGQTYTANFKAKTINNIRIFGLQRAMQLPDGSSVKIVEFNGVDFSYH